METLRNLRDHLLNIETEVSRTILSIERGLESLEEPPEEPYEEEPESVEQQPPSPQPTRAITRRSSLAADTMGGPNFPQ